MQKNHRGEDILRQDGTCIIFSEPKSQFNDEVYIPINRIIKIFGSDNGGCTIILEGGQSQWLFVKISTLYPLYQKGINQYLDRVNGNIPIKEDDRWDSLKPGPPPPLSRSL